MEALNFEILSFLLHGYDPPQHRNTSILAIVFSLQNFRILPTHQFEFFLVSNAT